MWYFVWFLGVLLACAFSILNSLWIDHTEMNLEDDETEEN